VQHFHLKNSLCQSFIGKGHKGGFATLAERKSRLYLALPIVNKTAQNANDAINKKEANSTHKCNTSI
jgi:IS30 family transposase